jgi:hypothetical protein
MKKQIMPRAEVRLRLDRGTAVLREYGLAGVLCALVDLSEGGCQCRICLDDLDDASSNAWKSILNSGRVLSLEMTEPPELRGLAFKEAQVRWVRELKDNVVEFGLHLGSPAPEQKQILGQVLLAFATNKLRRAVASGSAAAAFLGADVVAEPAAEEQKASKAAHTDVLDIDVAMARRGEMPRLRPSRHKYYLPAVFEFCGAKGEEWEPGLHQGRTVDLSEGGFLLEGPAPECCDAKDLAKREAHARVTIRTSDHDVKGFCRVRSVAPSKNLRDGWFYGLEIVEMADADRTHLHTLYERAAEAANREKGKRRDGLP